MRTLVLFRSATTEMLPPAAEESEVRDYIFRFLSLSILASKLGLGEIASLLSIFHLSMKGGAQASSLDMQASSSSLTQCPQVALSPWLICLQHLPLEDAISPWVNLVSFKA